MSNKIPNEIFSLPQTPFCLPFSLPGNRPFSPKLSFQTGDLWKIRENYVNDTAPAESREMLDPKRGKLGVRKKAARGVGGGGRHIIWNFPLEICGLSHQF